jgi:hypothetical protein
MCVCVCVYVCFFIYALFRVPAHKYVLATGSTVFYAMLYGGLADDSVDEISGEVNYKKHIFPF